MESLTATPDFNLPILRAFDEQSHLVHAVSFQFVARGGIE